MAKRITIEFTEDGTGHASVKAPEELTDEEVLEILSQAVDAIADRLQAALNSGGGYLN